MTLREMQELERKRIRKVNEQRQKALGFIKPRPSKECDVVTPEHIVGKSPEERAEFFRKLREEAGLL
jgi:hypothetical protein